MRKITDRQLEVLTYIAQQIEAMGVAPSYRDLAAHFNIGIVGVKCHIDALCEKGYLNRIPKIARSLALTATAQALLGKEAGAVAGKPIPFHLSFYHDDPERYVMPPQPSWGDLPMFAVPMDDDSMVNVGIKLGDTLWFEWRNKWEITSGGLYAVRLNTIEGEACTLRCVVVRRGMLVAAPASAMYTENQIQAKQVYARLRSISRDYL